MVRKVTPEFKRECAELIIIHGYKHKDETQAMSVALFSIQRWVTQYKQE
ncbi:transposase [Moellerella wisconsensis]|uniref:Transposase n=1 Tax=Moellerella wisconsensis ATCC 35017 TaxID=1354267 RepID=A0A0N0I9A1_9GAMM|nr:transposase [Moellerella wisconsensis]KPD01870.1 hypothetical protein M992_2412 [Moellerella wisconsensis ATCC 35017]VFS54067.1 Uncharacterised protein [Moellerella wisconsensis]